MNDPRLLELLTFEDMVGIAARIYIQETTAADAKATVSEYAPLAADPRKVTTIEPLAMAQIALKTYINKRIQEQRQPPDPGPNPPGEPPPAPAVVSPASGEINQDESAVTLAWTSPGATAFDVYFGTSGEPPLVSADQAAVTYDVSGLAYDTVYYWKVNAKNANGTAYGVVWSFRTRVEPPLPIPPGREIIVLGGPNAAVDFQAALNTAEPGDTIRLEAGQLFTGNFVLPEKATASTDYITIDSTNAPAVAARMTPTIAAAYNLPKLQSTNPTAPLRTALNAHHWRIKHLEILHNLGSVPGNGTGISMGDGTTAQNSLAVVAHHIEVLECYIHGTDAVGLKRGIALNCANGVVARCHISNCWFPGVDSQAVCGWNGPGPFLIEDNFLEAGSENVMFGGSDPAIAQLVPADITILRNHFYKPLTWIGDSTKVVKNLLEFKSGERILVDGNMFENNWAAAQGGSALLWKTVNQDGGHTQNIVQDILFTNNVVRNVSSVFNWLATQVGSAGLTHPRPARGFEIVNNLFYNVNTSGGKGGVARWMITIGIADVNILKNTVFHSDNTMVYNDPYTTDPTIKNSNWSVRGNNFHDIPSTGLGWKGASRTQGTGGTFAEYYPNIEFENNVLADFDSTKYSAGNYFPANVAAVAYTNLADPGFNKGQGAEITVGSPWKGLDADNPGEDTGVDWTMLAPAFDAVKPW